MKSTAKALQRNYNAVELELYCQNRFYGPLVVALNTNRPPYYLSDFSMTTLSRIEGMNKKLHNRNIKEKRQIEITNGIGRSHRPGF